MPEDPRQSVREVWEKRYREDPQLGSGRGSKGVWKAMKLRAVERYVATGAIRSILDLGCGDLQVMGSFPLPDGVTYTGVDFSEEVVAANRARHPERQFTCADLGRLGEVELPRPDLVLCFDVLFHLDRDKTYDGLLRYLFGCGARAAILTCTVTDAPSGRPFVFHRDFHRDARRLGLAWHACEEQVFRRATERLLAFSLEPLPLASETVEGNEVHVLAGPSQAAALAATLRSLVESGSTWDRLVVPADASRALAPEVALSVAEPGAFAAEPFAGPSRHRRVVVLEAGARVLEPLERLWAGRFEELLVRRAPEGKCPYPDWKPEAWHAAFERNGLGPPVPPNDGGVLVFQDGAHLRAIPHWIDYVLRYRTRKLPRPRRELVGVEGWALSLAAAKIGLDVGEFGAREVALAEGGEAAEGAVVHLPALAGEDRLWRRAARSAGRWLPRALRARLSR